MKTKSLFVAFLIVCMVLSPILACAEEYASLTQQQTALFEAVRWSVDFPKDAQVLEAVEYMCKTDGIQVRLLLVKLTQNEHISNMFGNQAGLMLIDLEEENIITYANCIWPDQQQVTDKTSLLNLLFAHWDSYTMGYNPHIFMDSEITFPVTPEDIAVVNHLLNTTFMKPE